MRAVVYEKYGPPEVLRLADIEQPTPKADEVLVRVRATTVNRTDCGFRKADPFVVRFFSGLSRPRKRILGTELAGEIEAAGPAVRHFKVGDHVFGVNANRFGTHAEYVCIPEDAPLAVMPDHLSFDGAAAMCDGALLAMTYLKAARVRPGQSVVIYGASGSIGTAAVQLTKYLGAKVTAVCSTKGFDVVSSLGPERVINFAQQDFTANGETYDVIFDAVGKLSFGRCRDSLRPGGIYMSTDLGPFPQNPLLALLTSVAGGKKVKFPLPRYAREEVLFLKGLIEAGKYLAVIDRRYTLDQVVEATRYVETEQKIGNVILTVG